MKLGSIGEFGLIERFAPLFMKNIPEGTLGIGDDCAVIPLSAGGGSGTRALTCRDVGLDSEASVQDDRDIDSVVSADRAEGDGGLNSGKARIEGLISGESSFVPGPHSSDSSSKGKSAAGECLLVTTDLLLENVHFLKTRISAEDLGYKSLAVNLSDIAGMGGTPLFAFLSIALPKDTQISWTDDFFKGFNRLASETGTLLMGGDTTGSKEGIVINVAVIGKSDLSKVKYRSGAKLGDYICISGITGESAAGLQIVLDASLESKADSSLINNLLKSHNAPRPHINEGLFLSGEDGVHAMMDVSDGIDSDLRHIMNKSHLSAEIDLDAVPLSDNLKAAEEELGVDPFLCALAGGEDYCLLLTVDPEAYNNISSRFEKQFGHPLYRIGKTAFYDGTDNQLVYKKNNKPVKLSKNGFDHFSS